MNVRFYNIDWVVDDLELEENEVPPTLPKECIIREIDEEVDITYEGADILSDRYGFFVNNFNFEIL